MKKFVSGAVSLIVGLTFGSTVALNGAQAANARVMLDCSASGTAMTLTLKAKTRGGGKPEDITLAGPVFLVIDQKIGHNFRQVTGLGGTWQSTELPVSGTFEMCATGGSIIDAEASSIRGRGVAFIDGVGFVSANCSPDKPPSC